MGFCVISALKISGSFSRIRIPSFLECSHSNQGRPFTMFAGTFPIISADEAASHIPDGAMVALSGFANAGTAKAIPRAIAKRARQLHSAGKPYKIRIITGSSSGNNIDEELAQAEALSWRAPFQSAPTLRNQINSQEVQYIDM